MACEHQPVGGEHPDTRECDKPLPLPTTQTPTDRRGDPIIDYPRITDDPERQSYLEEPQADDRGFQPPRGDIVKVVKQERAEEEHDHPAHEPAKRERSSSGANSMPGQRTSRAVA